MIDLRTLSETVENHIRVARVVIADSRGSTPREKGASMLVWEDGALGSIGGGRLEYQAMNRALKLLKDGSASSICRQPLGPALGQCCGGSVTLVTELWDRTLCHQASESVSNGLFIRRIEGSSEIPDRAARRAAALSGQTSGPTAELVDGWLVETVKTRSLSVLIYGAGHVGAALARALSPLPQFMVTVADLRTQLNSELPDNVLTILGSPPQDVMASAPPDAAHYIMTHEHELDLELCHLVLGRPFAYVGLIGSKTKLARFQKRLRSLGHSQADINRITCPIGNPRLGKHPQAIAIGTVAQLLDGWPMSVGQEVAV